MKNAKITKNKNLENEAEALTDKLEKHKDLFQKVDPDSRKMKIMLLRVPQEISVEELEDELKDITHSTQDGITIIKSIATPDDNFINWFTEAPANLCRQLVKLRTIKIFIYRIRAELYIRVIRCTKCKKLNDHTTSFCEYQPESAICANRHRDDKCSNNKKNLC